VLKIPDPDAPRYQPAPLSKRLQNEIEESANQFAARFGAMRMLAEANGWVRDYKSELERLVRLALELE
jgi:hypothetical protein